MFKTVKSKCVSQTIVKQIRELIFDGMLKPGERLPSVQNLSKEFGVSQATLREAIRVLEALGMLEVRQGVSGGVFISEINNEITHEHLYNYFFFQNPDIKDFSELRLLIEPKMAEIAATNSSEKDLLDLENLMQLSEKELDKEKFYFDLDNQFHSKISKISGNQVIVFVVESTKLAVVNIKQRLDIPRSFFHEVYNDHIRIVNAIKNRNPEASHNAMYKHIQNVEVSLKNIFAEDQRRKIG
ncbi:MAG TPA: hypothetical protein DCY12_02385 [Candidatus Atribacteria bacterium]|nr:hypothetical protein [Candidatus Atribacteria bacterium]